MYKGEEREVGTVRYHDLRTQAPQFSASARQSTRKPEKTGNALVDRRGERAPHNDPPTLTRPPSVGSAAEPPSGGSNCTASWRLHIAPSESHVSRGSCHSALRPAWRAAFAA